MGCVRPNFGGVGGASCCLVDEGFCWPPAYSVEYSTGLGCDRLLEGVGVLLLGFAATKEEDDGDDYEGEKDDDADDYSYDGTGRK